MVCSAVWDAEESWLATNAAGPSGSAGWTNTMSTPAKPAARRLNASWSPIVPAVGSAMLRLRGIVLSSPCSGPERQALRAGLGVDFDPLVLCRGGGAAAADGPDRRRCAAAQGDSAVDLDLRVELGGERVGDGRVRAGERRLGVEARGLRDGAGADEGVRRHLDLKLALRGERAGRPLLRVAVVEEPGDLRRRGLPGVRRRAEREEVDRARRGHSGRVPEKAVHAANQGSRPQL